MSLNPIRRGLLLAITLGFLATPFIWASAQAADITVFAAASLKYALDDASKKYEAKTGDKLVISYAAFLCACQANRASGACRHLLLG